MVLKNKKWSSRPTTRACGYTIQYSVEFLLCDPGLDADCFYREGILPESASEILVPWNSKYTSPKVKLVGMRRETFSIDRIFACFNYRDHSWIALDRDPSPFEIMISSSPTMSTKKPRPWCVHKSPWSFPSLTIKHVKHLTKDLLDTVFYLPPSSSDLIS